MRIMLDTNILISILFFNSKSLKDVLLKITDNYTLVLSSYVIEELRYVIERKFPSKYETYFTPKIMINSSVLDIRDIKDVPVLYSSIMADVDVFITGDKDFADLDLEKPEILTPAEFLKKY